MHSWVITVTVTVNFNHFAITIAFSLEQLFCLFLGPLLAISHLCDQNVIELPPPPLPFPPLLSPPHSTMGSEQELKLTLKMS